MLSIGARVRHPKAGLGKVLYLSDGGLMARVRFDHGQIRLIFSRYLSLTAKREGPIRDRPLQFHDDARAANTGPGDIEQG